MNTMQILILVAGAWLLFRNFQSGPGESGESTTTTTSSTPVITPSQANPVSQSPVTGYDTPVYQSSPISPSTGNAGRDIIQNISNVNSSQVSNVQNTVTNQQQYTTTITNQNSPQSSISSLPTPADTRSAGQKWCEAQGGLYNPGSGGRCTIGGHISVGIG